MSLFKVFGFLTVTGLFLSSAASAEVIHYVCVSVPNGGPSGGTHRVCIPEEGDDAIHGRASLKYSQCMMKGARGLCRVAMKGEKVDPRQ